MNKKEMQNFVNTICKENLEDALNEFTQIGTTCKKLRSCRADVTETEHFFVLRSYCTVVAVIDKTSDTLYDVLRYVYGYTATSAQHISKFDHDYCRGYWGCENVLTYRDI